MTGSIPNVSIGVPVYNGARYLRSAVESMLDQTFEDFELLILDNASTDETPEIGRALAAEDDRVRYERNRTNLGGLENFNRCVQKTRGQYFKWAACDDRCAPTFLERCVALLGENPDAVLAHTGVRAIDAEGDPLPYDDERGGFVDRTGVLRSFDPRERAGMLAEDPAERFAASLYATVVAHEVYGLIRRSALERTDLMRLHGQEGLLVSELGLLGRFVHADEPLFLRRFHPGNAPRTRRELIEYQTGERPAVVTPPWRSFFAYLRAVITIGDLSLVDRLRCASVVFGYAIRPQSLRYFFVPGPFNYWGITTE